MVVAANDTNILIDLYNIYLLLENKIITKQTASIKLKELIKGNVRLPRTECERRIAIWEMQ